MPQYDLRCADCAHAFQIMASIADRTARRIACPECGSDRLEAVFRSAPAYIKNMKASGCPSAHVCGAGCCHAQGN